jgi:GrpB-like predicted nucleotidyltransferase (UPF0157 family)
MNNQVRRVELLPYDSKWKAQFEKEKLEIQKILGNNCCDIQHIGSTSIPGIYAKPVIDVLVVVNDLSIVDSLNTDFESLGYLPKGEFGIAGRRFYLKGAIDRTHHIHLFEKNDSEIKRHLAFKDYILQHKKEAEAYSWVKRCLAEQFPSDIESYVKGKDSFVCMMNYRAGVPKKEQLEAKDNVVLKPHDSNWKKLAAAEIKAIQETVALPFVAIEHLGSTSIEGISAKPIIDIFIALESINEADDWIKSMESLGYIYWAENPNPLHRRFYKGMPPYGVGRTHHVHIMQAGKKFNQRILFRDALNQDLKLRKQYEALKLKLLKQYSNDREAYTEAKSLFISQVIEGKKL